MISRISGEEACLAWLSWKGNNWLKAGVRVGRKLLLQTEKLDLEEKAKLVILHHIDSTIA